MKDIENRAWAVIARGALLLSLGSLLFPVMTYVNARGVKRAYNIAAILRWEDFGSFVFSEYRGEFLQGMSWKSLKLCSTVLVMVGVGSILASIGGIASMIKQYESTWPFALTMIGLIGTAIPSVTLFVLLMLSADQYLGTMRIGAYAFITPLAMTFACVAVTTRHRLTRKEMLLQREAKQWVSLAGDLTDDDAPAGFTQDGTDQMQIAYGVDLVLCVDCTESMDNILEIVKERALTLHRDIQNTMHGKQKHIDRLRVRVIALRDYLAYENELRHGLPGNEPMLVTDFFELPRDATKLSVSVRSLQAIGGGDPQEDGLEALSYAIRSKWMADSGRNRHVIVLWTDEAPHSLGFALRSSPSDSCYPLGMPRDFSELSEWWGDGYDSGLMPLQSAKRLILFAPEEGAWKAISSSWDMVMHVPSRAGDHLQNVDYQTILSCIAQTV